jgi:carbon-monoxide dehydrogenase medium subunit
MKSPLIRESCPLVSQALAHTGPVAVRSRATVGGTLAHADRVAELPAVAVALDAIMVVEGATGRREVAAADFFLGDLTTAIRPGEFLREVLFPITDKGAVSSFSEVSVRHEGVALVGLAACLVKDGGRVRKAAFAAMGVDAAPRRLRKTEAALEGRDTREASIEEIGLVASSEVDPIGDSHATAAYRKHVVGTMVKRALQDASR